MLNIKIFYQTSTESIDPKMAPNHHKFSKRFMIRSYCPHYHYLWSIRAKDSPCSMSSQMSPRISTDPQVMNGCICCTVRGDLVKVLKRLKGKLDSIDGS